MDTSKEYIKMCEKAEEIQKIYWDFNYSDNWLVEDMIMACKEHQKRLRFSPTVKDPCEGTIGNLCLRKSNEIWLPRQDQLQEMVKSEPYFAWNFIGILGRWADQNPFTSAGLNSMEQIWLALVMKERYSKTWNGEDWIVK